MNRVQILAPLLLAGPEITQGPHALGLCRRHATLRRSRTRFDSWRGHMSRLSTIQLPRVWRTHGGLRNRKAGPDSRAGDSRSLANTTGGARGGAWARAAWPISRGGLEGPSTFSFSRDRGATLSRNRPRGVSDAHDSAKVEGQVRLLARTCFDSDRFRDAGARRPGHRLQPGFKWVRLPPASFASKRLMLFVRGRAGLATRRSAQGVPNRVPNGGIRSW